MYRFNIYKSIALLICTTICVLVSAKADTITFPDESIVNDLEHVVYDDYCGFDKASVNQLYNDYIQALNNSAESTEVSNNSEYEDLKDTIVDSESIPTHILRCIEYAEAFWRLHLPQFKNLWIRYLYKEIDSAVKTEVLYQQDMNDKTLYLPSALLRVENNIEIDKFPDGEIYINSLVDWNDNISSYSYNYELTQGIIQAIAKIMGLGSSLIYDESSQLFKFQLTRGITRYDNLIKSNDGICLSDFKNTRGKPSAELTSYITEDDREFYLDFPDGRLLLPVYSYKNTIASPFSTLNDGFMSLNRYDGDLNCVEDQAFVILKKLGWTIYEFPLKLCVEQAPNDDIYSWFGEYDLSIKRYCETIENIRFCIDLPLVSGDMESIEFEEDHLTACLPDIEECSKFAVNTKGILSGKCYILGNINGIEYKSQAIDVTFDLKPLIEKIDIIDILFTNEYYYNVKFAIHYTGGSKVVVNLEEDNSSLIRSWTFYGSDYIENVVENILGIRRAWLDFYVENQYGHTLKTIEFNPGGNLVQNDITTDVRTEEISFDNVIIYDLFGKIVWKGDKIPDSNYNHYIDNRGVYIIEYYLHGCPVQTNKVLVP